MQLILQKCDPADILWLDEFLDIKNLEIISEGISIPAETSGPIIHYDSKGLSMTFTQDQAVSPTRVDFLSKKLQHRLATTRRSEGLPKAAGLDKAKGPLSVIDATAGLGADAYILAALGCQVQMLEKSGLIAALLYDGLRRGLQEGAGDIRAHLGNMALVMADAHAYMVSMEDDPDVITLDPMFPPRKKTARVKKDMALMQQLLPPNEDEDIEQLLELACQRAKKRVVLKRPGKMEKHPKQKPDFQVPGRACHFQVFLTA